MVGVEKMGTPSLFAERWGVASVTEVVAPEGWGLVLRIDSEEEEEAGRHAALRSEEMMASAEAVRHGDRRLRCGTLVEVMMATLNQARAGEGVARALVGGGSRRGAVLR